MTPFRARHLTVVTLLAIVYFTTGKLGLMLAFVHVSATAVWPPAGIALAALLLLGYRVWPGIFFGAFLVNITTAGTVLTTLGIAIGNTLEGVVGAYLINRFANGRRVFDRPYYIFLFAVLAGLVSTTIGATLGATSLALGNVSALNVSRGCTQKSRMRSISFVSSRRGRPVVFCSSSVN
jgi:integral membrane sensor domain MASE1